MRTRYLESTIADLCFTDHKMAFISGPRQVGKTTLARRLLHARGEGAYYNWDEIAFRRIWAKDPRDALPLTQTGVPLVVFDEIHKARHWKRSLKGIYDTVTSPVDIVVTGSARLTVYRKGSDSLMGRYYHFRLHPFTLGELAETRVEAPDDALARLFSASDLPRLAGEFEGLRRFGGFPEPYLAANERKANLWRRARLERVIREDLRDLSRIPDLSRIEMLASLVPERVGSPLSRAALSRLLEVSPDTVRRWVGALDQLYYLYEIKPYHRAVARTLRKEGKVYLWDWSEVDHPSARLENLVASHLLKFCHTATDAGYGDFDLWTLRTKERHEIDFLITRDRRPWLPVEVKSDDVAPAAAWARFLKYLYVPHALQLTTRSGHWSKHRLGATDLLVADAARALTAFG